MQLKKKWLVGIDEAGRGPLAGPVSIGLVVLPAKRARSVFKGLKDSKHLAKKQREEWFLKFKADPEIFYAVTLVGSSIIDRLGISKAVKIGIGRVLKKTSGDFFAGRLKNCSKILLDGSLKAPYGYDQKTIIKGDEKIGVIAAASVAAKVTRDRKMARFAEKFPKYGFEIHKGYGTGLHCRLIKKHGLCPIHRRSFLTKILG
ncbi:MAG: ribonuclease HII [Patescibacteria group bacterium]|mgnify:CR=1 FL=1